MKSLIQIYLFIVDNPYFLWKNKNKLLFNFQMFLLDTLLYFSTTLLTLLCLVSHKEFHEFLELRVSQQFLRKLGRYIVQRNVNFAKFTSPEIT